VERSVKTQDFLWEILYPVVKNMGTSIQRINTGYRTDSNKTLSDFHTGSMMFQDFDFRVLLVVLLVDTRDTGIGRVVGSTRR
jgi:hypothetical protein